MSNFVNASLLIFQQFSFISDNSIKIHEYSSKIVFLSDHNVKVICLSIELVPSVIHYNS